MSYQFHISKELETNEGLIYIAFVGISDAVYQKMVSTLDKREGYGFVRVDDLAQIDNLSIGDVDAIVVPAESRFVSMTKSAANIIRTTENKELLDDPKYSDAYLLSDEQLRTKNAYKNVDGKVIKVEIPLSFTEEAMDYVVQNALFKRRTKLLEEFKTNFPSIIGVNGELNEERLLELYAEKDVTALEHVKSVANLVSLMGIGLRALGVEISDEELEKARKVGLIHDIGKLYTPDQLLKNTDDFTDNEYSEMRRHASINFEYAASEEIKALIQLAEQHHFKFDGRGYNDQDVAGNKIPLISRMMITLDAFDAITDISRGYQKQAEKPVSPLESAISILYNNSGTQFDPICSHAFLIGFRQAFENDVNFRNKWLAREQVYFEQRTEYLKKHPNEGTIGVYDAGNVTSSILELLDNTIENFDTNYGNDANKGL